jgi:hypothetical protein
MELLYLIEKLLWSSLKYNLSSLLNLLLMSHLDSKSYLVEMNSFRKILKTVGLVTELIIQVSGFMYSKTKLQRDGML